MTDGAYCFGGHQHGGDTMSKTPETDAPLRHVGGSHQDCVTRLERLIPVSRKLERQRDRAVALLRMMVDHEPRTTEAKKIAREFLAELDKERK